MADITELRYAIRSNFSNKYLADKAWVGYKQARTFTSAERARAHAERRGIDSAHFTIITVEVTFKAAQIDVWTKGKDVPLPLSDVAKTLLADGVDLRRMMKFTDWKGVAHYSTFLRVSNKLWNTTVGKKFILTMQDAVEFPQTEARDAWVYALRLILEKYGIERNGITGVYLVADAEFFAK